jgi:hypothetical protein
MNQSCLVQRLYLRSTIRKTMLDFFTDPVCQWLNKTKYLMKTYQNMRVLGHARATEWDRLQQERLPCWYFKGWHFFTCLTEIPPCFLESLSSTFSMHKYLVFSTYIQVIKLKQK